MNEDKQRWIANSTVYRLFEKGPKAKLDAGIDVIATVIASTEEGARELVRQQVEREYFVDDYRLNWIKRYEDWYCEVLNDV